ALQRVDVVGHERAEKLLLHRVQLATQARAAALAPEDAANLRMRRQIFLDAFTYGVAAAVVRAGRGAGVGVVAAATARGFAARPLFRRVRVVLHVAGVAGEQLRVDVGPARFQIRLRLRRIRELIVDPLRRLIDARLDDVVALVTLRDPR